MIHRKNLELIKLTEELALNRYCEIKHADDDQFEFGVCTAPAANALVFEFNLNYPDVTPFLRADVEHLLNVVYFNDDDTIMHLKFAN